ncbi:hypothetical protein ACJRO7_016097, partial [Eucalyptus globulus]
NIEVIKITKNILKKNFEMKDLGKYCGSANKRFVKRANKLRIEGNGNLSLKNEIISLFLSLSLAPFLSFP